MTQLLDRSYKGRYPFRIATTSFIYRADYVPNVKRLGPYLDEIELLIFDSTYPGALPSPKTVSALARLAVDLDLTYNVHLPTDVFLGHQDPAVRRAAVATLARVIDLTAPLVPTTLTLHLLPSPDAGLAGDPTPWQERIRESLEKLIAKTDIDPRRISAETLDYPFSMIERIIEDLDLSVCMDLGHLFVHGHGIQSLYERHRDRVSIIHLHGVEGKTDHLSLGRTPSDALAEMMAVVMGITGTVSIEVFSFNRLVSSLTRLEALVRSADAHNAPMSPR